MTDAATLHRNSIVFDGLQCCNWSRALFEEARAGGVTCINAANLLWQNFQGGLDYINFWKALFAENADLIMPVRTVADIRRAKETNRTGIVVGWQNTSPIEDQLSNIGIFKDLGVGIMQLTYNTQNYSGAGYLELNDGGLTGFGREVIDEMNRVGVLCDLSHVGDRTSADVIAYSKKPVVFSHVLPRALKDVKRNKPDELFKACAEKGGIVGISLFAPGLRAGNDATVHDVLEAMAHVLDVVGEDHVGIGTDFSLDHERPGPWMIWANRDKGYARQLTEFGNVKINKPQGIRRMTEMPALTAEMVKLGWSDERIVKVLGGNWLRVLNAAWGG